MAQAKNLIVSENLASAGSVVPRDAEFYKELFSSLDNNAVLRVKNDAGVWIPVSCTKEFARMMECEPIQFIEMETRDPLCTVYPDDREDAAYFLEHGCARDGGNHIILRKRTLKGNLIWVDFHFGFFAYEGRSYAYCNYFDVTALKESEHQLQALYEGVTNDLQAISGESLVSLRVDLTTDQIEARDGKDLYDSDKSVTTYGEFCRQRVEFLPLEADKRKFRQIFNSFNLIASFNAGHNTVSDNFYSRRQNGRQCFVNVTATIRQDPMSGNTMVFITEMEYNSEKVNETMNRKILAKQYDMITYVVDGQYGVVIGDADSITKGSIFPKERTGSFEDYVKNQILPVVSKEDHDPEELAHALSPETVEREVREREPYVVNVICIIDGEKYYKRFDFYAVDPDAKFFILLKSDYTEMQREQLLRNEQLKDALQEAKAASVAKTSFLSRMSHEIRTPMNAIIGLDTIALQEEGLTPAIREHLDKIGGSARYLLSLINDILDMSRIESGRMTLKNEEFEFRDFIDQINTIVNSQCQDKGLNYDCFIHGKLSERYIGDAMKLKQVLINILGNAVKFTNAPGDVTLDVKCLATKDKHSTLQFVIKDTGIGMDAEYLPKIFEAFSQEDGSNTNKYGGSGLGMAISKNIVNMMNGDISVASVKGEGSTFTVEVTLRDAEESRTKEFQQVHIKPEEMKILVIDDDPIACQHAKIVLGEHGFHSEACLGKDEALEMIRLYHARREDFNLILVDLRMPGADGIETTRAIREVIGKDAAVIILTAYNWNDIEEDARDAGIDGFMRKPLYGEDVIREFHAAHRRRQIEESKAPREADITGVKILLAEDMAINAEIMKRLLKMKGAEAEIAENGQIALDRFKAQGEGYYDAILMDIRMPVMDGLQATEAIRALGTDYAKRIPIISMTANAFDEDVQRSLQAGMDAHLSKPVEPEKLYETLDALIHAGEKE